MTLDGRIADHSRKARYWEDMISRYPFGTAARAGAVIQADYHADEADRLADIADNRSYSFLSE